MIDYYTDAEMYSAKKQKKKTLIIYFIVLGVYIAASLAFLTYFWTLPYSGYRDTAHKISLIKWGHYSLTAIFVIFSFIYLGFANSPRAIFSSTTKIFRIRTVWTLNHSSLSSGINIKKIFSREKFWCFTKSLSPKYRKKRTFLT